MLTARLCGNGAQMITREFGISELGGLLNVPIDRCMHPQFPSADSFTEKIIGGAIEVHRAMGPGLIESIYEWCLSCELQTLPLACEAQRMVRISYKQFTRDEPLRFDLLVERCVLVEIKACETILPIHKAQLLSYMRLLGVPVGLLFNFHSLKLTEGMSRLMLPGANLP
jgi:GxxExxY protein